MNNNTETIFPEGMSFYLPHNAAPEWIKGDISIDPTKFVAFMRANRQHMSAKGYFRFQLCKSKSGSMYLKLDTFKPAFDKTPDPTATYSSSLSSVPYPGGPTAQEEEPF